MNELLEAISEATTALKGITAATLTPAQLDSTKATLDSIDVAAILENYGGKISEKAESDEYKTELEHKADQLNKKIDPLNDALEEVKKLRATLDLEALDPIIQSARNIVRKLYSFSASIQE